MIELSVCLVTDPREWMVAFVNAEEFPDGSYDTRLFGFRFFLFEVSITFYWRRDK